MILAVVVIFLSSFTKGIVDVNASEITTCWEKEEFVIKESCRACSAHDIAVHDACAETGYVEILKCKESGLTERSCRLLSVRESHSFWVFEATMFSCSVVAGIIVMIRMRKLDRENMERIQRQLSAL